MKQVRVSITCDACAAWHGAEVEDGVDTVHVVSDQTLDLCPDHRETMAPFLQLVAEWAATGDGRKVPPVPSSNGDGQGRKNRRGGARARTRRANTANHDTPPPGSFQCPLCTATPSSHGAFTVHLSNVHHTNQGKVYGGVCPLCAHEGKPIGLGVHARMAHGITSGVPGLFAKATAEGDPHGVIASRTRALAEVSA